MKKRIIVISAPSGVGKSTLIQHTMPLYPKMTFSVSATTRAKRTGETDGKDYFFMDVSTFQEHIRNSDFLEHAEVYGNLYGTLIRPLHEMVASGLWPILDIDAQGLERLHTIYPSDGPTDILSILVLPKSLDVLEHRLRGRNTDTEEIIKKRMQTIHEDIRAYRLYRYVIVNDILDDCLQQLKTIIDRHPHLNSYDHPELFLHQHAKNLLGKKG